MSDALAFLGWSDGRVLVGRGPFSTSSTPPVEGVAFYHNDFGLNAAQPWVLPAEWEWMTREGARRAFAAAEPLELNWEAVEADDFAAVFQEISDTIRLGKFQKTVPVVTEEGRVESGNPASLFQLAMGCPSPLVPYGFLEDGAGFVGQSPEYLLRLSGRQVWTMALAGTARSEEREVLAVDEKEIREHEFVAQALVSRLGNLGKLDRGAREIMELGPIVHFHTPIGVELERELGVAELIDCLHPTPALGPLPRTEETMGQLVEWRKRLKTPAEFGAPFGAVVNGEFQGIVAIRGLWWQGKDVHLPAGCGVIEASRLVNEWRELRLKRAAVKQRFDLDDF